MTDIAQRLLDVTKIVQACAHHARDGARVKLLAVSKTFGVAAVQAAWDAGQRAFGENHVAEAVDKIETLSALQGIEWHLIGPLQSNKTALVAQHFDWVQTIDRFKIAQRLNDQRPMHLPPLKVCIQVNVDGGITKSGIDCTDADAPESQGLRSLMVLAHQINALPRLELHGLLAIPEPEPDPAKQRAIFDKVKRVFDGTNTALKGQLDTLSMGMSADYESAICAGSTMVRVGSAIFGERAKKD